MDVDRERVFENLAPPPGGLEDLRSKLDLEFGTSYRAISISRWPLRSAVAAAAAAVLLFVGLSLVQTSTGEFEALLNLTENPATARLGLSAFPSEPVSVMPRDRPRVVVKRVEVADPGVVFYRVAVLARPSRGES